MVTHRLILLIVCAMVAATGCSEDTVIAPTGSGRIVGTVVDSLTRAPVTGATIRLTPSGKSVPVDSFGSFTISELAEETYTLTVDAAGYATTQRILTVKNDQTSTADFELVAGQVDEQGPLHSPSPVNGATESGSTILLRWKANRTESKGRSFDVYVGPSTDKLARRAERIPDSSFSLGNLAPGKHYWQVVLVDETGNRVEGPIWNFVVSTSSNQYPTEPAQPSPANFAYNQHVIQTLKWQSSDPEGGELSYRVYGSIWKSDVESFDSSALRGTIAAGAPAEYRIECGHGVTIYWRIVAIDDEGLNSIGPVWMFETYPIPTADLTAYFSFDGTFSNAIPWSTPLTVRMGEADSMKSLIPGRMGKSARSITTPSAYSNMGQAYTSRGKGAFTLSLWYNADGVTLGDTQILVSKDGSGFPLEYRIGLINSPGAHRIIATVAGTTLLIPSTISNGQWHHVSMTWSVGGEARVYVDGVLQRSFGVPSEHFGTVLRPVSFVASLNSSAEYRNFFYGAIDDIRTYTRELTGAELLYLYHEDGYGL